LVGEYGRNIDLFLVDTDTAAKVAIGGIAPLGLAAHMGDVENRQALFLVGLGLIHVKASTKCDPGLGRATDRS